MVKKMRETVFTNNVAQHPRTCFPWAVICRYGNLRGKKTTTKKKKKKKKKYFRLMRVWVGLIDSSLMTLFFLTTEFWPKLLVTTDFCDVEFND